MKKNCCFLYFRLWGLATLFCCVAVFAVSAQELLTAPAFFDQLAARYAEIEDYAAQIDILSDTDRMSGEMSFVAPNRIRIDFTEPVDQVLASNGLELKVYVPRLNVTLLQGLRERTTEVPGSMATAAGLQLLRRNYSIAYSVGPNPVPLSDNNPEPVVKLMLNWRNTSEGFRQIEIAVGQDGFIRRISGITAQYRPVQFDFRDVTINQRIPLARFDYVSPASSNIFNNFLFGTGN